jgi:hypothetical protein
MLALGALNAPKPIGENAAAEIILKLLGDGLIKKSSFRFSTLVVELASTHFAKEAFERNACRQPVFSAIKN